MQIRVDYRSYCKSILDRMGALVGSTEPEPERTAKASWSEFIRSSLLLPSKSWTVVRGSYAIDCLNTTGTRIDTLLSVGTAQSRTPKNQ
jgi:hypothetical protein